MRYSMYKDVRRLGGFAAFGDATLAGDLSFKNPDAATDFLRGIPASAWRDGGPDWPGLSAVAKVDLQTNMGLAGQGVPAIDAAVKNFRTAASNLMAQVDLYQQFDNSTLLQPIIGGRSAQRDGMYRNAINRLNNVIVQFNSRMDQLSASANALAATPSQTQMGPSNVGIGAPGTGLSPMALTAGGGTPSAIPLVTAQSNAADQGIPIWVWAAGGGILLLGGALLLGKRHKAPAMAGYRRRSRR